jgi:hypothetical protein
LLRSEFLVPQIAHLQQARGVIILLFLRDIDFEELDFNILVHVLVLLLKCVRVMGVGERHSHAEWSGIRALANMVIEELL